MTLLVKATIAFFWGILMHGTAPLIDMLPGGWGHLTRSGVGVLAATPIHIAMESEFEHVEHRPTKALLVYGATFLPFGLGVFAGYLVENFLKARGSHE